LLGEFVGRTPKIVTFTVSDIFTSGFFEDSPRIFIHAHVIFRVDYSDNVWIALLVF
jgi:hypothetical protein